MKPILFILLFTTVFLLVYIILSFSQKDSLSVKGRLKKIARKKNSYHFEEELNQPLYKRILKPVVEDLAKGLLRITPKEMINNFEKKIIMAGQPYNFTIKEWTNIQAILIVVLPSLTLFLGLVKGFDPRKTFFLILIEVLLGFLLPNLFLTKKIQDRKKEILKTLPDVIDFLTVSVEAGLGFDGALAKVVDKMPGQIANEFNRVLQEMKMGKPKKEALKEMSNRVGLPDLTTFVGSIIQAEQLGVSIGNVLRIQSEQMRQKRRQRAQEKAMKAPIKMLLPMVFFIFPTIFTVLIGPVIIKMIKVFMNQ